MTRFHLASALLTLTLTLGCHAQQPAADAANPAAAPGGVMRIDIDATDLPRHLLRSTLRIPVAPGPAALWFPEWIPGIHGPSDQIQNMGGLTLHAPDGQRIAFRRDDVEMSKFHFTVPPGVEAVEARLTYIANQPTRTSRGVESFGNSLVGVISFNTCVLYLDGRSVRTTEADVRVKLPEGWKHATALRPTAEQPDAAEGWVKFERTTLERLVDSPLIAGRHMHTLDVRTDGFPPVSYHFTSESPSAIRLDDELTAAYRRLAAESAAMFGSAPFDRYDFLVVCSDLLPNMGLEHLESSLNGVGERDLVDPKKRTGWAAYLLPHEYVHAWCGKYLRPAGMVTDDFHTEKHTDLLWVYEGLTQYLGEVLTVRSGLLSFEKYQDRLARKIGYLSQRAGRSWRSLEDTAISGHTLRGGSAHWNDLRRSQDYYDEGALFWLHADAIIRAKSDGRRTLDDFCRSFFARRAGGATVVPFTLDEVIAALNASAEHDWRSMIEQRIASPADPLALDFVEAVGYRVTYVPDPPAEVQEREAERKVVGAEYSLGLTVSADGEIGSIVPNLPADKAKLAQGMKVIGVNDRKFTPQRLRDAIADSTTARHVTLLILDGDLLRTVRIDYDGGARYMTLTRHPDRADVLSAIFKPRTDK